MDTVTIHVVDSRSQREAPACVDLDATLNDIVMQTLPSLGYDLQSQSLKKVDIREQASGRVLEPSNTVADEGLQDGAVISLSPKLEEASV
jgi:hypothetical protein